MITSLKTSCANKGFFLYNKLMKTKEEKLKILKEQRERHELYEKEQKEKLKAIKSEPRHFFKLVWFYFKKPFVWIKNSIKDIHTLIIFIIVFLAISIEVWVPYLFAIITWGTDFSKWCLGFASTCWLFWLLPFTPFLPLCIALTFIIKGIFDKIRFKKLK